MLLILLYLCFALMLFFWLTLNYHNLPMDQTLPHMSESESKIMTHAMVSLAWPLYVVVWLVAHYRNKEE